jgi:hypothetical protein
LISVLLSIEYKILKIFACKTSPSYNVNNISFTKVLRGNRMFKNLNLVKRFLIFSALSVIVAGIVLVQTVGYLYRFYFVNDAMRSVVYTINSSIQSRINEKDSLEAVVEDRIFLKGLADNLVKYNDVVSVKLWSIDGTIIYAQKKN